MAHTGTILVVDDEESMRDSCCQALRKDGHRVETAVDGDMGLRRVRELKPDLVLVDLKMPGISGLELLEKIRQIDPEIVSVVITGYATIESAVQAMKRDAYDFLPKPFSPDQLRIIVNRGLQKRTLALESAKLRHEKKKMQENFVSLVSHQLRSPLVSVRQYFEVILEGFAGPLAARQKEMMEEADRRIDELVKLINDWLDMSHIDAEKLTGTFGPVALDAVLSQTMELLVPAAEAKEVTLTVDCPDGLPSLHGCKQSLKQAFVNLVTNAINYNRPGGDVAVRARQNGESVVVDVSDTGIGIPGEVLPFVFQEFFRAKNDRTRDVAGSGLGLAIAKRIIEAHNGSISVTSNPGQGTTFSVLLPKPEVE